MVKKLILSKNANNKKCASKFVFFNEKKNEKDLDDFWHRKLTLKVKFWHFLTPSRYSNFPNLVFLFEYSWFLAKNLSNFVSLPWKLHNPYCHNVYTVCISILIHVLSQRQQNFAVWNNSLHRIFESQILSLFDFNSSTSIISFSILRSATSISYIILGCKSSTSSSSCCGGSGYCFQDI